MAWTADELKEKRVIEQEWLRPHKSVITGDMLLTVRKDYGVPLIVQLCILGAETSIGDPEQGGLLVTYNNFGCMKYSHFRTRWAELACAAVRLKTKPEIEWLAFENAWVGMAAWGRFIKVGTEHNPGVLKEALWAKTGKPDWDWFADVYYGFGVPGLGAYKQQLKDDEATYRRKAALHGVVW